MLQSLLDRTKDKIFIINDKKLFLVSLAIRTEFISSCAKNKSQ